MTPPRPTRQAPRVSFEAVERKRRAWSVSCWMSTRGPGGIRGEDGGEASLAGGAGRWGGLEEVEESWVEGSIEGGQVGESIGGRAGGERKYLVVVPVMVWTKGVVVRLERAGWEDLVRSRVSKSMW